MAIGHYTNLKTEETVLMNLQRIHRDPLSERPLPLLVANNTVGRSEHRLKGLAGTVERPMPLCSLLQRLPLGWRIVAVVCRELDEVLRSAVRRIDSALTPTELQRLTPSGHRNNIHQWTE